MFAPQTILGWRKDGRPIRVIAGGDNTATASPSPQAQASPSAVSVGGFNFTAPTTTGSSTDLYGLGTWRDQTIDVSGFPTAIVQALSKAHIDTSAPVKASDIAAALESIKDPQVVARLQQMLFYSGMYTSGTTLADLQLGHFGDKDEAALANAVVTAGRASSALGSYLSSSANVGYAQGIINKTAGVTKTPLVQPSPIDEDAALRSAAEKLLGREPSAADLAGFRGMFDQAYLAGQKQAAALQAQSDAQQLPDANSLGGAMGRLGLGLTDAAEAPPQTLTSQGESATAAEHDQLTQQSGLNPLQPGLVDTGSNYQNSSTYTNPAYSAYAAQQQADLGLIGQVQGAADANAAPATVTNAPNVDNAAEDYIRSHDAAGMAQQNVATKYATLLSILSGTGA